MTLRRDGACRSVAAQQHTSGTKRSVVVLEIGLDYQTTF